MATKSDIYIILDDLGIAYPPTATMAQLKKLLPNTHHAADMSNENRGNTSDQILQPPERDNSNQQASDGEPSDKHVTNIDAEIENLEKMCKLARLRAEIRQLETETTVQDNTKQKRHNVQIKDVQNACSKFTGIPAPAVKKWFRLFEVTCDSYEVDEKFKLTCLRGLMQDGAAKFVENKVFLSYTEMRTALIKRFSFETTSLEVHRQLLERKQKANEDNHNYVLDMESIGTQSDSVSENEIVEAIISGLKLSAERKTILYTCSSIRELTGMIRKFDIHDNGNKENSENRRPVPVRSDRCFNCSEYGHIASNCVKPKKRLPYSCFSCGEAGHMVNTCPKAKPRRGPELVERQQRVGPVLEDQQEDYQRTTDSQEQMVALVDKEDSRKFIQIFNEVSASFKSCKSIYNCKIGCVFDSGSPITMLELDVLPKSHSARECELVKSGYKGIGGPIMVHGIIKFTVFEFKKGFNIQAYIVPTGTLPNKLLLGRDAMRVMNIGLMHDVESDMRNDFPFRDSPVLTIEKNYNIETNLRSDETSKVRQTIENCYENYPKGTVASQHSLLIDVEHNTPISHRPRRLSYAERNQVNEIIENLVNEKIVRPSNSPYSSPIVLVKKKNGQIRMCVDYRQLNKITVKDNFPLPLIDDCIDYLSNKNIFTLLDLKSGFHQVSVHKDSVKYTSFVTPDGQWEFTKMPFGLKNAPSVFQRYIIGILKKYIDKGEIKVYLDDILLASNDFEAHLILLENVLKTIADAGLELQLEKCFFAQRSIEYLGYIASADGISPGKTKTKAIEHFPTPTNVKDVQSFIGLCSYFRRFVRNFSIIARPLYDLTKKEAMFNFDKNCQLAFEKLKNLLTTSPILCIYDPSKETELHTDASALGFGAILMQRQSDERMHPVAYFSRASSPTEAKYHSYVLETLAIYHALERFRVYLEGIQFAVVTDCNSLVQATEKKELNRSIAKWLCEFMRYDFTVRHRHGTNMAHVDALSRAPLVAAIDYSDIDVKLRALQSIDLDISTVKSKIKGGGDRYFKILDHVVYRKMGNNDLLFYVPKDMEDEVIRTQHEKLGHPGSNKTYDKLRNLYWFPNMKEKVEKFIAKCVKCILYSQTAKKTETNLHSIEKVPLPFHTLHIDHFGPLPSIRSKRKHLLVIIDSFTKFIRLYPVNSTSSKEVICALEKYFNYYSRPVRLVSDRGTCFTSSEFSAFMDRENIDHVKTAVAAPQANGQVERVNRIIKNMLGKITEPIEHSDWVSKLTHVELAVNNSKNRSTGECPSVLLFGVKQKGKTDLLSDYLEEKGLNRNNRDLQEIRNQADINIKKSQEYAQKWYEDNSKGAKSYNVGDLVYIRNVDTTIGSNKKFVCKFKGPYVIHKVLPNDRYCVKDIQGCQLSQVPYDGIIEAKNIKLWVRPEDVCNNPG